MPQHTAPLEQWQELFKPPANSIKRESRKFVMSVFVQEESILKYNKANIFLFFFELLISGSHKSAFAIQGTRNLFQENTARNGSGFAGYC